MNQGDDNDDKKDLKETKEEAEKDIFEAIGVGNLPDDQKAALLTKMMRLVEVQTLNRIIDKLTPEQDEKLKNLPEDDPDALEKFLEEYVPNYGDIYMEEAAKVRQKLLIQFGK